MYLSEVCLCERERALVLADSSLFVEAMPLERLDLSLCVRERSEAEREAV